MTHCYCGALVSKTKKCGKSKLHVCPHYLDVIICNSDSDCFGRRKEEEKKKKRKRKGLSWKMNT